MSEAPVIVDRLPHARSLDSSESDSFSSGIVMSIKAISGDSRFAIATASWPFTASPQIVQSDWRSSTLRIPCCISGWSSASRILNAIMIGDNKGFNALIRAVALRRGPSSRECLSQFRVGHQAVGASLPSLQCRRQDLRLPRMHVPARFLGLLALGNVLRHAKHAQRLAGFVKNHMPARMEKPQRPVSADDAEIAIIGLDPVDLFGRLKCLLNIID